MFRVGIWHLLTTAVFWGFPSVCAFAQTELKPLREIRLPVSSLRGAYAHYPIPDMSAKQFFSMRVAPDQSLLVLDSDTSGNWPLVRLRKWWTDNPVNEVLSVPGWKAADAKYMDSVLVDLQITLDGRYAVAFAGAVWRKKSDFIFHAPSGYVARRPDTIITVIDLSQWKIVSSVHTMGLADGQLRGARIVSDKWIVLDFELGDSPLRILLYRYVSDLISVPELHSGPECVSDRQFRPPPPPSLGLGTSDAEKLKRQNNTGCEAVLQTVGVGSVDGLEILIDRGQDVLPLAVERRSDGLERTEDDYFRFWGEYPYYLLTAENPPFESSSHWWYGLYNSQERGAYDLEIFDAEGQKRRSQTVRNLMCGDPSLEQQGSACGCRVIDVSEEQHDLLAFCRTQRGDYDGMVRREWLAVLHSDDFSGAGFISLSKKYQHETLEEIARADGRSYVVTLEIGETLRVYAIPDRP
ncbi:MAG: hypothetical protein ABR912_03590 [Terracidiphilus sp.]